MTELDERRLKNIGHEMQLNNMIYDVLSDRFNKYDGFGYIYSTITGEEIPIDIFDLVTLKEGDPFRLLCDEAVDEIIGIVERTSNKKGISDKCHAFFESKLENVKIKDCIIIWYNK